MKTLHIQKPNQEMTKETGNLSSGLMGNQANPREDEWLSHQFSRVPFLLYRYWLILNLPMILVLEGFVIHLWFRSHSLVPDPKNETIVTLGLIFAFSGSIQMLFAIIKKKSRTAQKGFVQFQYVLCSSLTFLVATNPQLKDLFTSGWLFWFEIILSPIFNLVGGFAVLQVFKKNHPLARLDALQASEEVNQDFVDQNGALASEFSKYDKQLSRWPYMVYEWFLKLSLSFELIFHFQYTVRHIIALVSFDSVGDTSLPLPTFLFMILWGISSLPNAYSCFQMEVATRTRNLAKSKRAMVFLKICTLLSIIKCFFMKHPRFLDSYFDLTPFFCYHWIYIVSIVAPFFGLIGALKVNKILEERETFVKASSYSEDTYL